MLAVNSNLANGTWFTRYYHGKTQTLYTGRIAYTSVVPGGMVQGNFVDPNNWNYDVVRHRWDPGTLITAYSGYGWDGLQDLRTGWVPGQDECYYPSWTSSRSLAYNRALERLNSKVRGDLDLGVTLAELGSTRRMLSSAGRILTAARVRGIGSTRDVANGWLQWQYGWSQLARDVFAAANESLEASLSVVKRVAAGATVPIVEDSTQGITVYVAFPTRNRGVGKASCRMSVELELPGATLDRWSSLNPVSLGWELIPFSFVADWVYDVGSYLRAAETAFLYGMRFRSGYVSELMVYDGGDQISTNSKYVPGNPNVTYNVTGFKRQVRIRRFVRTKLTSYPLPRPPVFHVDLGSQRLLTLAALLRQLLK